jgi:hypothetical protein
MKTFEQYIVEQNLEQNLDNDQIVKRVEMIQRIFSVEPFSIQPVTTYKLNRMYNDDGVIIGLRNDFTDARLSGYIECQLILRKLDYDARVKSNIMFFVKFPTFISFMRDTNHNIDTNSFFVTHQMRYEETRVTDIFRCWFNIFNYYQSLQDKIESKPLKIIKTLEFARTVPVWLDEWDLVLNQLKMKYLPQEELTDDDHALNASLNL